MKTLVRKVDQSSALSRKSKIFKSISPVNVDGARML